MTVARLVTPSFKRQRTGPTATENFVTWLDNKVAYRKPSTARYLDGPLGHLYMDDSTGPDGAPPIKKWIDHLMYLTFRHGVTKAPMAGCPKEELRETRVPHHTTLVFMRCYLERIENNNPGIIEWWTVHRLLLVCCLLTIKFVDDQSISYKFIARHCSVAIDELTRLENATLFHGLRWNLNLSPEQFEQTLTKLLG